MHKNHIISYDARRDIASIWEYIAADNPVAADYVLQELSDAMQLLGDHPGIGHVREDLTRRNVKFWSVRHYVIVYEPETKPLHILHVMSSYRDIEHLINPL